MQYRTSKGEYIEKPEGAPVSWRPSAYGLAMKDGAVLCIKPAWNDQWELPGGAIEFGETIPEAVAREFQEETSLVVTRVEDQPCYVGETRFASIFVDPPRFFQTIIIVYKVEIEEADIPDVEELGVFEGEVSECKWVPLSELTEETMHPMVWPVIRPLKS